MAFSMRLLAFALLGVSCRAEGVTSTATAWGRAKEWMRAHESPDADQAGMNDLKSSDPGAFAIVQALITKSQMGLLDPTHLSASLESHHDKSQDQSAVEILRGAPSMDVPISEVAMPAAPAHKSLGHNPWTFKARSDDDEAMVQNVLGAAAELKGGSASFPAMPAMSSFLSSAKATYADAAPVVVAPVAKHEASMAQKAQHSYMKDINFAGMFTKPAEAKNGDSNNLLTSFSWNGDDALAAKANRRTETQYLQEEEQDARAAKAATRVEKAAVVALKKGSLGSWLRSSEDVTSTAEKQAPAPEQAHVSSEEQVAPKDPNAISDMDSYMAWAHSN